MPQLGNIRKQRPFGGASDRTPGAALEGRQRGLLRGIAEGLPIGARVGLGRIGLAVGILKHLVEFGAESDRRGAFGSLGEGVSVRGSGGGQESLEGGDGRVGRVHGPRVPSSWGSETTHKIAEAKQAGDSGDFHLYRGMLI